VHTGATIAVLASCVFTLCGCNQVVSKEPWFTEADAEGAPQLRDGLWTFVGNSKCRIDVTKPVERWPDCSAVFVVRGREWFGMDWKTEGEGRKERRVFSKWESTPSSLFGGDPPIIQWKDNPEQPDADPDATDSGTENISLPYHYAAIEPLQIDEAGKVRRFAFWFVECGPPPSLEAASASGKRAKRDDSVEPASSQRFVTDKPFPGLTIAGNDCTAESKEAVRGAAKLSKALNNKPLPVAYWVRDGYR
jgi:hypothetical protein